MGKTKGRLFSIGIDKRPTKAQLVTEKYLEQSGLEFISVGMGTADYKAHNENEAKAAKDYLKHSSVPAFETGSERSTAHSSRIKKSERPIKKDFEAFGHMKSETYLIKENPSVKVTGAGKYWLVISKSNIEEFNNIWKAVSYAKKIKKWSKPSLA